MFLQFTKPVAFIFIIMFSLFCIGITSGLINKRTNNKEAESLPKPQSEIDDDQQDFLLTEKRSFIGTFKKNKVVKKLLNLYRLIKGNTTNPNLNSIVSAFITTFGSPGFNAINWFVNTVGNSVHIYDAVRQTIQRTEERIRARMGNEDKYFEHLEREKFQRELTTSLNRNVEGLVSMNRAVLCLLYSQSNDYNIRAQKNQFCLPLM